MKTALLLALTTNIVFFTSVLYAQNVLCDAIKVINKSNQEEKFYLKEYGYEYPSDSAVIAPGNYSCFTTSATKYPLYSIQNQRNNTRYYFFKDVAKRVQVDYLPDRKIQVHGSYLNDVWTNITAFQDSAMNKVWNSRTSNSDDSIFIRNKNDYEKWGFETFISLVRIDTFLSLRFLNFHLQKLKSVIYTNPILMDSMITIVRTMQVDTHPLVVKGQLHETLENLAYLREGANIYHFDITTIDGDTLNTNQYSGKKVLIDFWASWCKPCREKNQVLKKHYNSLESKGIEVLGISLDDNYEGWRAAVEADKLPWLQGIPFAGEKKNVQQKYNAVALPLSVLFLENGKLIKINPSIEYLLSISR